MINRSAVLAVAFGLTFPLVLGVSRTGDEADYSDGCPSLDPVVNLVDLVYGVNAIECELVGSVLDLGNHVSVQIPDKGEVVGAAVDTTDGTSQVYVIATAPDGAISATVSYHDPSMLNPELAAAVAANPDGAVTLGSDIAREDSESVVLAYSRCTDNSSAATGFQWYTSATIGVWVNGTDRKPTNISSAVFASVASTVLNRWKIGADGCSLSGSPTGLDLANFGSTTRDANIANGTTTCGSRDNYNVIDWGDLPGSTYGYTCWWGSGLQTLEFDTRTGWTLLAEHGSLPQLAARAPIISQPE